MSKLAAQRVDILTRALVGVGNGGVDRFESLFDGFVHDGSRWLEDAAPPARSPTKPCRRPCTVLLLLFKSIRDCSTRQNDSAHRAVWASAAANMRLMSPEANGLFGWRTGASPPRPKAGSMLTCVACARSAPTVHFSRPSTAKGSYENSRMAFRCVILLITSSLRFLECSWNTSAEVGQVQSECG